jgi:hypothetical protein
VIFHAAFTLHDSTHTAQRTLVAHFSMDLVSVARGLSTFCRTAVAAMPAEPTTVLSPPSPRAEVKKGIKRREPDESEESEDEKSVHHPENGDEKGSNNTDNKSNNKSNSDANGSIKPATKRAKIATPDDSDDEVNCKDVFESLLETSMNENNISESNATIVVIEDTTSYQFAPGKLSRDQLRMLIAHSLCAGEQCEEFIHWEEKDPKAAEEFERKMHAVVEHVQDKGRAMDDFCVISGGNFIKLAVHDY